MIERSSLGCCGFPPVALLGLGAYYRSAWTPASMFTVSSPLGTKQADGSVVTPGGSVLPAFAACEPGTTWDFSQSRCVPAPGTRNINYECGGLLAPWGVHPECVDDSVPSGSVAVSPSATAAQTSQPSTAVSAAPAAPRIVDSPAPPGSSGAVGQAVVYNVTLPKYNPQSGKLTCPLEFPFEGRDSRGQVVCRKTEDSGVVQGGGTAGPGSGPRQTTAAAAAPVLPWCERDSVIPRIPNCLLLLLVAAGGYLAARKGKG